jgi:phosphoesterase RecJ-like protein
VDPSYTSASEMVADLTYQAQKKLDKQTAQTIYFGIVTDSLRFLVQTTSERTFKMATYLMGTNFNLNELYQHMYHKNLNVLKAQGQLIETMQLQDHVGAIFLTPEIMQANQISYQQNGMFSNLLKDVDGIDIWVTFAKNADET